jgi:SnoaL-like domain
MMTVMSEHTDIIEFIDSIFDTVDAKDWDTAEKLFAPTVDVDFTSLTGGEPAAVSNVQLVDGWRQGLHAEKKSFHLVGHYRVRVNGDTAAVTVKGYAYNVLEEDLGGGMWEVWGDYDIPLRRADAGWEAAGITFRAWHSRGDESVRTHLLSS